MTRAVTIVGPADHGRRMSLEEFDTAEGVEGRAYELSRGVVVVTDVPNPPHGDTIYEAREQLSAYSRAHPGVIHRVYSGAECKLLIADTESERHPDLAIYKTPCPGHDSTVWSAWIPEIVIEVVSVDSGERHYNEKADDYLRFGVQEYWVIDKAAGRVRVHLRRSGRWQISDVASGTYTTKLLPGFELNVAAVLAA
jgi:Uma2 family endonuclease